MVIINILTILIIDYICQNNSILSEKIEIIKSLKDINNKYLIFRIAFIFYIK